MARTIGGPLIFAAVVATGILGLGWASNPASAQNKFQTYSTVYAGRGLYAMRNVRPGMPGIGTILREGVKGYSRSGWEIGRMMSRRQYGTDPGPWPGLRQSIHPGPITVFGRRY